MTNAPNPQIRRALHLSSELTTATELLALGLNQVADARWDARQPGGAFNQLAQGVERVLKLTFGLSEQSHGRAVDARFGSGGAGHALITLHAVVMDTLVAESDDASPYVRDLLSETLADPIWNDILRALDQWAAVSGRYRDLDAIRGKEVHGDPPSAHWEEAEHRVISEMNGWGDFSNEVIAQSRQRMLSSIMCWWHTIYRSWQNGLVGEEGGAASSELDPRNRHLDPHIANLVNGR